MQDTSVNQTPATAQPLLGADNTPKPIFIEGFGEFGNGRYSKVMAELYGDTQRLLGFGKGQAHTVATRLGVDLGKLQTAEAKVTYGKSVSKDGYRTVKEVAGIKVIESFAITCAALCAGLDALRKQGLMTVENTVSDTLLESINAIASRLQVKQAE